MQYAFFLLILQILNALCDNKEYRITGFKMFLKAL